MSGNNYLAYDDKKFGKKSLNAWSAVNDLKHRKQPVRHVLYLFLPTCCS